MRSIANKSYRTFIAGMVTEASPLTYPENASTSEDNCIIFQKGNRSRRLGFRGEPFGGVPAGVYTPRDRNIDIYEFSWEAVNENGERDFVVQRIGHRLHFFDNSEERVEIGTTAFSQFIDLRTQAVPGKEALVESSFVQFASGRGLMFVVGRYIEPFVVEFDEETDQFIVHPTTIRIRDFIGVDDGLANDFEPPSLSPEHDYNLRNQGWVSPSTKTGNVVINPATGETEIVPFFQNSPLFGVNFEGAFNNPLTQGLISTTAPIQQYFDQIGLYPGNNKQWWLGRITVDNPERGLVAGDFDPDILCDLFVGNTRAARGHFVLNAFDRDREGVSGVSGIPRQTTETRPCSVSFYAGKVWYAHESDLYYSQTVLDFRQAGNCFQEADPTSETISDIIATDGGRLPIPEAHNITRIHSVGGSLVVFAENGVWSVQGGQGGFSATDISVNKVSSNGIIGERTLVEANGTVYWFADTGIMTINQRTGLFGSQEGVFDRANITEQTISSFYHNRIPLENKFYAKGVFDPIQNRVQWLFKSEDSVQASPHYFDRILNLDLTLNAFYPWTIDNNLGNSIVGVHLRTNANRIMAPGITTQEGPDVYNSYLRYAFVTPLTTTADQMFFGDFDAQDYTDFETQPYTSFMETGYELLEDLMRPKQSNYVFLYFRRTDDELQPERAAQGIGSSCWFQTKWDWSRNELSNRFSRKVQGYQITDNFKEAVVVSRKIKVRGHGRAIQLRFESSEIGTTFDLLGWATSFSGRTTV